MTNEVVRYLEAAIRYSETSVLLNDNRENVVSYLKEAANYAHQGNYDAALLAIDPDYNLLKDENVITLINAALLHMDENEHHECTCPPNRSCTLCRAENLVAPLEDYALEDDDIDF